MGNVKIMRLNTTPPGRTLHHPLLDTTAMTTTHVLGFSFTLLEDGVGLQNISLDAPTLKDGNLDRTLNREGSMRVGQVSSNYAIVPVKD